MPVFTPGLALALAFYADVVAPLVGVPHTACLLGEGSEVLGYDSERSVDHEWGPRVQLFVAALGVDPRHELDEATWLGMSQQRLLPLTRGGVFRDDAGELTRVRRLLAWYPRDVWRWLLASQWRLIGTTEPLLGRLLELGDQRGARLRGG